MYSRLRVATNVGFLGWLDWIGLLPLYYPFKPVVMTIGSGHGK